MKIWKHFSTITKHRNLVRKGCFCVGLYRQGMMHDMSKYSPTEFWAGCRFYQGNMSPNNAERRARGYSGAWLHHKGRNKHHYEYWIDYSGKDEPLTGMKMPVRYVVEMFIDRMSASKVYQGENYTDSSALEYYNRGKKYYLIHEESQRLLEDLLQRLSSEGEHAVMDYIKKEILKKSN